MTDPDSKPVPFTCDDALEAAALLFHASNGSDAAKRAFGTLNVFVDGDFGARRLLEAAKRWRRATFAHARLAQDYATNLNSDAVSDAQLEAASTESINARVELRKLIAALTDDDA